jgi:hypothetical protein
MPEQKKFNLDHSKIRDIDIVNINYNKSDKIIKFIIKKNICFIKKKKKINIFYLNFHRILLLYLVKQKKA